MRFLFILLFMLVAAPLCIAEGSIEWTEVSARVTRSDPKLVKVISDAFDVSPVGIALRLGPRSIDVIEGKAEPGKRVPPYEFDCKPKGQSGPFSLRLKIDDGDANGRWRFSIQVGEK